MATRSVRHQGETMLDDWQQVPERAPSQLRADTPTVARYVALLGFFLIAAGCFGMFAGTFGRTYVVGPATGLALATLGIAFILYHAFSDWEAPVRRLYGFFAIVFLLLGVVLRIIPTRVGTGAWFLPYGTPLLAAGFLFTLAVLRHETEQFWKALLLRLLGTLGAVMILAGVGMGLAKADYVAGEGVVLILLGTIFVSGFIGMQSMDSDTSYYAGIALGFVGVGVFFLAALKSLVVTNYFIPSGLTLMATSLIHFALALGICSDAPFIVLTRRELAAFFYSPVAYLVLLGSTIVAGILFLLFINFLILNAIEGFTIFEPIAPYYMAGAIPIIIQMMVIPAITMRLLSEEQRSGTLEMLLTAPVNEASVVLAKFAAVLIFWLTTWIPYFLFLVGLRVVGGTEFDFRPFLSYGLTLTATGAGFLAMGLFFSSITRNQVIAAVLTFVALLLLLCITIFKQLVGAASEWREIFAYMDFYDLWQTSLRGNFTPSNLVFYLSIMVFFLFLSVKVLEARKWK